MIRIIINGIYGRLGEYIRNVAKTYDGCVVVAGVDKFPGHELDIPVFSDIDDCDIEADVIIDFSRPEAIYKLLPYAYEHHMGIVVATTGLKDAEKQLLRDYAEKLPIFFSANMSLGVNLQMDLIQKAAGFFGRDFDIEIVEKHHNQKVDAPSGTALVLAECVNSVFDNTMEYVYDRHSENEKRTKNEIGLHAVRGGTISGEHHVMFIGNDEILEVNHIALSRRVFAEGAIRAALYIHERENGMYCMRDIVSEQTAVSSVVETPDQALVSINALPYSPEFIARIFELIAENKIVVDMISQTSPLNGKVNISFTIPESAKDNVSGIIDMINEKTPGLSLDIRSNVTKMTIEGFGMERQSGVAARLFKALAAGSINILSISTSETEISFLVDGGSSEKTVEITKLEFGL